MIAGAKKRILLATLLVLGSTIGLLQAAEQAFTLEKVFEFKFRSWKEWPWAVLNRAGDLIYLLEGSKVQIIDRKSGRTIGSASYEDVPCKSAVKLAGWDFIPGRSEMLAAYCGSLFVVDGDTLKIKRKLRKLAGGLEVSPDGRLVAAAVNDETDVGTQERIAIFDTSTWEVVQSWPGDSDGISLSSDGKLLAIGRSTADGQKWIVRCGVEVREVSSGRVYSEWWKDATGPCPGRQPLFVPGDSNTLLTLDLTYVDFVFWDVKSGNIKGRIQSPRPVHSFLFSPDGRWLIADVANDPQDTPEYNQDFIVWDVASGTILYESPKMKWNLFETFAKAEERSELQLNNLSRDGRFLLVTRYKRLQIYEIIHGQASAQAAPTLPF